MYCNYPDSFINQSFYNAKLQAKLALNCQNIQLRHLSEIFKNKNVILSQKQPKNLLRLLTRTRFNTEINNFGLKTRFSNV